MDFIGSGFLIAFLIYIAVLIVLFFILRGFVLWYWKVNQMVDTLSSIDHKLGRLIEFSQNGSDNKKVIFKDHQPL